MKKLLLVFTLIGGLGLAITGCSSKPTVNAAAAEKAFANATNLAPDVKLKLEQGIAAAKNGEYGKALVLLDDLSYDLEDADQQAVLMELVQEIRDVLGDQADAAKDAALEEMKEATNHAESAAEEAAEEHEMPEHAVTNATKAVKEAADSAAQAAQDAAKKLPPVPPPAKQ